MDGDGDIQQVSKFEASIGLKRMILAAYLDDFAKSVSNQQIRTEILKVGHFFKCSHQDFRNGQDIELKLTCNRCMQDKSIQVLIEESQDEDKSNNTARNSKKSQSLTKGQDCINICQSIMIFFCQEVQKIPEKYKFGFQLVFDMLEKHGKLESDHSNDCYKDTRECKSIGLQASNYRLFPWPAYVSRPCHYRQNAKNKCDGAETLPEKRSFFGRNLVTKDNISELEIPLRPLDNLLTDPRNGSMYLDASPSLELNSTMDSPKPLDTATVLI